MIDTEAPTAEQAGVQRTWVFPDGARIAGTFLGFGTSRPEHHSRMCKRASCPGGAQHHGPDYVQRGHQCGHCEWFEVRLFVTDDDEYAIVTTRQSILPDGDPATFKVQMFREPGEVVEKLSSTREVRDRNNVPIVDVVGGQAVPRMEQVWTWPARNALLQAADYDDALYEAVAAARVQ